MPRGLVVVTGADGFIGRALCAHFRATGRPHRAILRHASHVAAPDQCVVGDLAGASESELDAAVADAFAVVHLAGRAHVVADRERDPAAAYHRANVEATVRLARAALRAGCERVVHASTVKVHGESSAPGRPLRPDDRLDPRDDYGRSKLAAEEGLRTICAGGAVALLVLRLPLVYGPGVKGNFLTLMDAIARGETLPLGAIRSRRSLLYVGNLIEAIAAALDTKPAPCGAHFVTDAQSVAVPELARAIGVALDEPVRLPSVPVPLLELGATLLGKRAAVLRLTRTLEVDAASFRAVSGWQPRFQLAEGLAETARWWRMRHAI